MSGGHFDYKQYVINNLIMDVNYEEVTNEFPLLKNVSTKIADWLQNYVHDLDWHLSSDTCINDFKKFEKDYLKKLKDIMKGLKNESKK